MEYSESGIYTNKYLISKYTYLSSTYLDLYNKYRQMLEYRIYCDSEYPISKIIDYILNNKIFKKKFRYLMFYFQQTVHSKSLFECISKILHTIFYFFICIFLFLRMSLSNIFGNKNEI